MIDIKKNIIEYCKKLVNKNFVIGSWGNISIKKNNRIYITPSGIDYDVLKKKDISVLSVSDKKKIGGLKPSTEFLLHFKIYQKNKDINSIIHTHSKFLTALSVLKKALPILTEEQAYIFDKDIEITKYYKTGSLKLAEEASEKFKNNKGVILANHGYVGGGKTLKEAFTNCLVAEKSAEVFLAIIDSYSSEMGLNVSEISEIKNKLKERE
ncbi:MAG TPA: class II aldolase/adducin family protein [Candidatus Mcinerneyibacterium sp.]|nr:class II aldolase/adducin family protein [Candidatus Mcinerneyibacterium sp.]